MYPLHYTYFNIKKKERKKNRDQNCTLLQMWNKLYTSVWIQGANQSGACGAARAPRCRSRSDVRLAFTIASAPSCIRCMRRGGRVRVREIIKCVSVSRRGTNSFSPRQPPQMLALPPPHPSLNNSDIQIFRRGVGDSTAHGCIPAAATSVCVWNDKKGPEWDRCSAVKVARLSSGTQLHLQEAILSLANVGQPGWRTINLWKWSCTTVKAEESAPLFYQVGGWRARGVKTVSRQADGIPSKCHNVKEKKTSTTNIFFFFLVSIKIFITRRVEMSPNVQERQ